MRGYGLSLAVVSALVWAGAMSVADADEPAARPTTAVAPHGVSAGWGEPQQIDTHGSLTSISCTSPVFCAAVGAHDYAVTYDGDTWSTPQQIARRDDLADVSCLSAAYCIAADAGVGPTKDGDVFTYRPSGWSAPTKVGGWLSALSCTSRSFCIANNVYPREVYTFDGSGWAHTADLFAYVLDVSCVSESMCVAVGDRQAILYDGAMWVATKIVPAMPHYVRLSSVSCVTASYCVTVDDTGQAYTYDGTGWSQPIVVVPMKPRHGSAAVSCGAVGRCVMVTSKGVAAVLTGDTWSTPERIDSQSLTAVSCPGPHFCAAVDSSGYAIVYRA
jgi:hypothetical protein